MPRRLDLPIVDAAFNASARRAFIRWLVRAGASIERVEGNTLLRYRHDGGTEIVKRAATGGLCWSQSAADHYGSFVRGEMRCIVKGRQKPADARHAADIHSYSPPIQNAPRAFSGWLR